MRRVLIATLGDSPAVVTEAIDALKEEGIQIDTSCILTTKDSSAQESLSLLEEHFSSFYGGKPSIERKITTEAYEDIDNSEAVLDFMKQACKVLENYYKRDSELFVSIAGGRKTMSALMTLAVQLYGAKELFHVIVKDPDLEEKGRISRLRHLGEREKKQILHPGVEMTKLVKMPFIGLFPSIHDIRRALRGEEIEERETRKRIKELLTFNKLIEDDKTTELGEVILAILEYVESPPKPQMDF